MGRASERRVTELPAASGSATARTSRPVDRPPPRSDRRARTPVAIAGQSSLFGDVAPPRPRDDLPTPEGDQREVLVAAFDGPLIGGPDPADVELVVDDAGLQCRRLDGQERVARGGGWRADAGREARDGELVFCLPGVELLAGAVADLGMRGHEDACPRPTHAGPPAPFPAYDLAVAVERRGVLAEVPDVALAVLG